MENIESFKKIENELNHKNIEERVLFECPEEVKGKVHWVELTENGDSVEAKLYNPETPNNEVIILMPGIPGDFTSFFESKHIPRILEEGYTICSIRRNGVVFNEKNNCLINSDQRLLLAQQSQQEHLGRKDSYSISDWIKEIEIVARRLLPKYQKVYFLGHSLGGFEIYQAVCNLQQQLSQSEFEKIAGILTLSGSIGKIKEGDVIDPITGMSADYFQKYLEYLEKENIVRLNSMETIKQYEKINNGLYNRIDRLPPSVNATFVAALGDEFISVSSALDLREKLRFGRVLMDYRQKRKDEGQVHDYPRLRPEDVMRWLTHKGYPPKARESLNKYYFSEITRNKMEENWERYSK